MICRKGVGSLEDCNLHLASFLDRMYLDEAALLTAGFDILALRHCMMVVGDETGILGT